MKQADLIYLYRACQGHFDHQATEIQVAPYVRANVVGAAATSHVSSDTQTAVSPLTIKSELAIKQVLCPPCCADLKGRADILAFGIDKYNEECRSIVMR